MFTIESNLRNVKKHCMFRSVTCALKVSLLQNSEMFENASCSQSVYLLQNSAMFKNEINNQQKLNLIYL